MAVGIVVANLYYSQPLVALIAAYLKLAPEAAGLILTLTQMGYGLGVLFLVPLGDVLENRRLILTLIGVAIFAVLGLALAESQAAYLFAALLMGLAASVVQLIVPYASHLSPGNMRGRVVGNLMSGLMVGIMLSRPSAGFLTDLISWRAVFFMSAILMTLLWVVLIFYLPRRTPPPQRLSYGQLLRSMATLAWNTRVLQRRAIYQACIFGSFCLFWTAVPLYLAGPEFHMSQTKIAFFALAGVAGAFSAPFAGRMADRGWSQFATLLALSSGAFSFLLTRIFSGGTTIELVFLILSAILLDAGVSANLVLGQRAIFSLAPEHRGRLNGLYIATIFVGGALGSSLGAWTFHRGGWSMTSGLGFGLPLGAVFMFLTEYFRKMGSQE